MKIWKFMTVLGAVSAAGCSLLSDVHTYRYRLTVEVETPQGVRSGSSVIESSASESNGLNGRQVHSELHGEAVAVDMPDGQTLFAVLDAGEGTAPFAAAAYREIMPKSALIENSDWKVEHDAIQNQTAPADVPPKYYPIMLRFTDINNPASVVKVDPANLAKDYGAGVRLKRVFVQMTDDPVTRGIEKRFSWWARYQDLHFDGTPARYENMTSKSLAAHMAPSNFSTDYTK